MFLYNLFSPLNVQICKFLYVFKYIPTSQMSRDTNKLKRDAKKMMSMMATKDVDENDGSFPF